MRFIQAVASDVHLAAGEVRISMSKTALNAWCLSSEMLTAMAMTAAGAHVLELRPKTQYEPSLYVRLHRTLYPNFGRVAGPAEALALLSTTGLAWWTRRRPATSRWAAAAAGSLAAAHAVFWSVVQPVNVEMMRWPLDAIPDDWSRWRDRWEYAHAVRAVLVTFALGAVTWALLADDAEGQPGRTFYA
jgi:hypothetical protein